MTKQEIFDKVVTHLADQGGPSMGSITCLYRGPDGRSCAVGCLIKDKFYDPELEGKGIASAHCNLAHDIKSSIGATVYEDCWLMLYHLQNAHDIASEDSAGSWEGTDIYQKLIDVAGRHDLDASVIEKRFGGGK